MFQDGGEPEEDEAPGANGADPDNPDPQPAEPRSFTSTSNTLESPVLTLHLPTQPNTNVERCTFTYNNLLIRKNQIETRKSLIHK